MNVTMRAVTDPCPDCGHELTGAYIAGVRVNLKSLRTVGNSLYFWPTCAPRRGGCGYQLPKDAEVTWRLEPDDEAKVEAARAKIRTRRKKAT